VSWLLKDQLLLSGAEATTPLNKHRSIAYQSWHFFSIYVFPVAMSDA
jgi:hypothetical protein